MPLKKLLSVIAKTLGEIFSQSMTLARLLAEWKVVVI